MTFNQSGEPYVAFKDCVNQNKASVKKFNGSDWINVGSKGFSEDEVWYIHLIFSEAGIPFICYKDNGYLGKATVMNFDGLKWANVGDPGFSAGEVFWTDLAFDSTNILHVVFRDKETSFKATVMKYDSLFVDVNEVNESFISLYPNPVSDNLILDYNNSNFINKSIEIFNLNGKKFFEAKSNENRIIIYVENYPIGIYIVKVKTESLNYIDKFCKN
jgi:hypothetical protein